MNAEERNIIKTVCDTIELPMDEVMSQSQKREHVYARFIAVFFIKKQVETISLSTIGRLFKKNSAHCFVIYALKMVDLLKGSDKQFSHQYRICENAFLINTAELYANIPQY